MADFYELIPSTLQTRTAPDAPWKDIAALKGEPAIVDPTLTQSGQAADAKAVGDALEGKADKDGEWELIDTAVISSDGDDYLLNIPDGLKAVKIYAQVPDIDNMMRMFFFYFNDSAESYANAFYWYTQGAKYAIMKCIPEHGVFTTLNGYGDNEYHYNNLRMGGRITEGFNAKQYSVGKVKSYGGLLSGTKIEVLGVRANGSV